MNLDQIINEKLELLQEEKYKLRIYKFELLVRIESDFGVEETLQDIRSIEGVTVVTALDSLFRKSTSSYLSRIRIKFHPQKESTTSQSYIKDLLLPMIRSAQIPGCKVIRVISSPRQVGYD